MVRASTLLLLLVVALPATAAKRIVLGQTFPIVEPDTMTEIRTRIEQTNWEALMKRSPISAYSAFDSVVLPRAEKTGSRLFDPTYALPYEIRDDNGTVLYPKGFRINIYEKMRMPGRIIVVTQDPADLRWLDTVVKPTDLDKVFLAAGNPVLLRQATGRKTFVLDERTVERFGLQRVPSIVHQEGLALRVDEYAIP